MLKTSIKTKFRNLRNLEFRRQRKFTKPPKLENIEPKTPETPVNIKLRMFAVWGVLMIAMLGLAFNLYRLQIAQGKKLAQKARNQQMVNLRPYIPRRSIVDRGSNILAIDRPVYKLYAIPNYLISLRRKLLGKLLRLSAKKKLI